MQQEKLGFLPVKRLVPAAWSLRCCACKGWDCGLLKSSLPAFSPRLVALGVGVVKTLRYPERKQTDLGARLWFLLVVWRGVGGAVLCPRGHDEQPPVLCKAPCSCLGKFRLATAGQGTSVGDFRQFHREEGWCASLPY